MAPRDADTLLLDWQRSGDPEALHELLCAEVRILKARLKRRVDTLSAGSGTISDIAQDAILRFLRFEGPRRFDHPGALRAYLWTIAVRLLRNRLRKRGIPWLEVGEKPSRRVTDSLATTGGLGAVERQDLRAALELSVNLLRAPEREILDLVYFRDLGIAGAAEVLAIEPKAANTRLVRARRALAERLEAWRELVS
ncbi:MAG: hypothetical protein CMJ18_08605 [Phycisphaeraceae bacterium]|nr:hypothetical protein [Phycisphaeraceae bacterium]